MAVEKGVGALIDQPRRQSGPNPFWLIERARQAVTDNLIAAGLRYQALKLKCFPFHYSVARDGELTATPETSQKGAFSAAGEFSFAVIEF
jgi:hypothetical protein